MSDAWKDWKKNQGESRPWHLLDPSARITDQDKIDKRYNLCKSCDHFIKLTTQCTQCGCIMKVKTTLLIAECPIGKWGKEENAK
jgi:hypothetical protein